MGNDITACSPPGRVSRAIGRMLVAAQVLCGLAAFGFGFGEMNFWPVRTFRAIPGFDTVLAVVVFVPMALGCLAAVSILAHVSRRKQVPASYWVCLRAGLLVIAVVEITGFAHDVMIHWR